MIVDYLILNKDGEMEDHLSRIDGLVYQIYELSESEIKIVEDYYGRN